MNVEPKVRTDDEIIRAARQRWGTPTVAVRNIEHRLKVRFGLDVCAESWSAKAPRWFGPGSPFGEDGLTAPWRVQPGEAWFCNPPFAHIDPWVERALAADAPGVMWVPPRTDRPWWHQLLVTARACPVYVEGRIAHDIPPDLGRIYGAVGKRPAGPGGGIVLWVIGTQTKKSRFSKADLLEQAPLPGLAREAS